MSEDLASLQNELPIQLPRPKTSVPLHGILSLTRIFPHQRAGYTRDSAHPGGVSNATSCVRQSVFHVSNSLSQLTSCPGRPCRLLRLRFFHLSVFQEASRQLGGGAHRGHTPPRCPLFLKDLPACARRASRMAMMRSGPSCQCECTPIRPRACWICA